MLLWADGFQNHFENKGMMEWEVAPKVCVLQASISPSKSDGETERNHEAPALEVPEVL